MQKIDKEQYLINSLTSEHIGDDAAGIGNTLYSMDAFFEDVHFKREWMSLTQIARKAMLVNLSDAVAMNAKPKYVLVTLSLPKDIRDFEIELLTEALESTARAYGCEIIGGDTIGGDKLHLSITIISESDNPLLRTGLKEGDFLAYTGVLGESLANLQALMRGEEIDENAKFYEPVIRAAFVEKARPYLRVGMDISDGLYCDTNKLLDINKYGKEDLLSIDNNIGLSGEEFEMLIGFDPAHLEEIKKIAEETGTPLTIFAKAAKNSERYPCKSHHF
ncbi:MAG: thiamine-phosphate kinase [Sulfurovum sp.]